MPLLPPVTKAIFPSSLAISIPFAGIGSPAPQQASLPRPPLRLVGASLGCATGGANNRISQENPHVKGLGLHYIWRSGVSRSGMLSFNAARILACSGLGRA